MAWEEVEDDQCSSYFLDDGRTSSFAIGNDRFPANLLDLPTTVKSYKTYDDAVLIRTNDVGRIIMVREMVILFLKAFSTKHALKWHFYKELGFNVFNRIPPFIIAEGFSS
ncbi:hypothetical protein AXF42_Ash007811 [Apostasia shenzhenica]|uniref:TAFII55 protein conserved region domain-containing protein n=1 Tax=Apostasia shenzhenica TaxID=1088818 RepID=A0A2I0B5F3_9ASPA|nr:hypothetical protein AXF42_Ash007811 [Apostasia shenzhenica]